MRLLIAAVLASFLSATLFAQTAPDSQASQSPQPPQTPQTPAPQVHAVATTYSHGYEIRRDIHKYASYATLPLFATEYALGQSLYNNPENAGTKKALHGAVGTGIVGLFIANTVTGGWNMWDSRRDKNGRTLRIAHGILMVAADVGFVATAASGPNEHHGADTFNTDKVTHRNRAEISVGLGTAGYLLMLFGHH
jgi:hypothetical protein